MAQKEATNRDLQKFRPGTNSCSKNTRLGSRAPPQLASARTAYLGFFFAQRRKVSARANVRHVKVGNTSDYASGDIEALASVLPGAAIKSSQKNQ
jgi:hypothetical protein